MAAQVKCYRAPSGPRQRGDPARLNPVHCGIGGKAVNKHHRIAGAFVQESDLDSIVAEVLHGKE